MHPVILQQLAAEHLQQMLAEADDARRAHQVSRLASGGQQLHAPSAAAPGRLNTFLATTAEAARSRFAGPVTYAADLWEPVNRLPFAAAADAYRDAGNAGPFQSQLRERRQHGKPLAVTESGCCSYASAGDRGGMGRAIIDTSAGPPRLDGDYMRDEAEQDRYPEELNSIFAAEGVDLAFWFTFAGYLLLHDSNTRHDLDMAGCGLVKMLPGGPRHRIRRPGPGSQARLRRTGPGELADTITAGPFAAFHPGILTEGLGTMTTRDAELSTLPSRSMMQERVRRPRRTRRWLGAGLAVCTAGWGANQFTPMMLLYRSQLGFSAATVEAMFGLHAIGLIPGLLVGGSLSDRTGRRRGESANAGPGGTLVPVPRRKIPPRRHLRVTPCSTPAS